MKRIDPEQLDKWHEELNELLEWQDSNSDAAIELESASFYANQGGQG